MNHEHTEYSDEQRRAYWTQQMDAAYDFMQMMREYPVQECGEGMASLPQAAQDAGVEVLFSDSPIALDLERVFFLREGLIPNFICAARAFNERGWIMKVEDGYRSIEMQRNVSRKPSVFDAILKTTIWECGQVPEPEFLLRRVAALTAVRPKVGTHMSGSAIDISVFDRAGNEIERGGPYLEMSEKTPMTSPFVSEQAQQNRLEIRDLMARFDFIAYPWEFWHFNSGDVYAEHLSGTQKPGRYGAIDFDWHSGRTRVIDDPQQALQTPEVMRALVEESLQRHQAQNT